MATNKINDKMYVGQTIGNLIERKRSHVCAAINRQGNMYFHKAIRKYGPENFDWEILDYARNIEELNELEIFFIKLFKTFGEGYNLSVGGKNTIMSKETKRRLSEAHKDKVVSSKTRKRMSESRKGKKHSIETLHVLSEKKMGSRNPMYGKFGKDHHSSVGVMIGNKCFGSRIEAAKFVGSTSSTIRNRILHKTKWMDYRYTTNK